MLWRFFLFAGLSIGLAAPLHAQQYPVGGRGQLYRGGIGQMGQMGPMPTNLDGTIVATSHGAIMVTDRTGRAWKVVVPANAKVQVLGTATADYLTNGLIVDFKAEFDDHGAIKDKVGELTIVTASAEQLGIFPASDVAAAPADNPAGGAGAAGSKTGKHGSAAGKTPAKSAAAKGMPPVGACRVVGRLISNHGKLSVDVHGLRRPVDLPLSDEPTIKLDLADYSLAAPGDTITVQGIAAPTRMVAGRPMLNAPGMVQANDVKITIAETLKGNAKKKASSAKSQPSKKDKDEGPSRSPAEK